MNSEFLHLQSEHIADSLMAQAGDFDARVRLAYLEIFDRPPTERDVRRATEFFSAAKAELDRAGAGDPRRQAWAAYARSMISSNEFLFID